MNIHEQTVDRNLRLLYYLTGKEIHTPLLTHRFKDQFVDPVTTLRSDHLAKVRPIINERVPACSIHYVSTSSAHFGFVNSAVTSKRSIKSATSTNVTRTQSLPLK